MRQGRVFHPARAYKIKKISRSGDFFFIFVSPRELESLTSSMSMKRSNQLSYGLDLQFVIIFQTLSFYNACNALEKAVGMKDALAYFSMRCCT